MKGLRQRIARSAAVLLVMIAFTAAAGQVKTIQIKGSDTMVNLGQAWAEVFSKRHPNVNIAVTGGGSGTGITALLGGSCDIAESSRLIEAKEIEKAKAKGIVPTEFKVALDGIAVVVHPKNPVGKLTIDQLREIFMGNITDWKTLGGPKKVIVILSREFNSGTHIFFKEHVIRRGNPKGPEEFSPAALLMPSSQAIADEVANNENAIGYYGMGYISARQKVVAVAIDAKSPYVIPALESVRANTYPISRPLYLYTNGKPQGIIKDFVDFAFSPEGQDLIRKMDFVPIK